MAGVLFLVLSDADASHAHVSVDILQQKFPPWMIRVTEIPLVPSSRVSTARS